MNAGLPKKHGDLVFIILLLIIGALCILYQYSK